MDINAILPYATINYVASNIPGELRMLDVLRDRLRDSQEIAISVSFLRHSGLGLIIDDLKTFAERGGQARILTSTYLGITQPDALHQLSKIAGVECRVHVAGFANLTPTKGNTGFHTKFFIFTKGTKQCWVGSSNLTKGGLASNIEANLFHSEDIAISAAENVFDILWNRQDVVPLSTKFAEAYALALSERLTTSTQPFTPRFKIPDESIANAAIGDISQRVDDIPRPNEAQTEAMERLRELRKSGESRAAIVAAPGIGKTFLAAFDAQQFGAKTLLFISHRLEHLSQAQRTFARVFNSSRSYGSIYGGIDQSHTDFIFATVQSASSNKTLFSRTFDYVIIDEFHHAEASSYQHILETISASFMLGLTATPERQDGHDVLRFCDYNVAYEIRLIQAINRGWLVPFHYFGVNDVMVDYSSIPWRSGGFDISALENALMLEERVDEILKHAEEKGYDGIRRATVGFCAGVRHAKFMAESFRRRGMEALAITGQNSLDCREDIYKRFADPTDPLEWIFVADVLNEGVDIPAINSLIFLRPTESATIFIQQLGRGLRHSDDCEVLTVLDFVGHHRTAWLAFESLHDRDAGITASSIKELDFTPPKNCEVILDQRTLEILGKIRHHTQPKKDLCLDAYAELLAESPRPYPLDLWGRDNYPDIGIFRTTFGSWIELRRAAKNSEPWEDDLCEDEHAFMFLSALERDWQQSRVYSYALAWGLSAYPEIEPSSAYDHFFERFPRWKIEYKPLDETKAWQTLAKKLSNLLDGKRLHQKIISRIPADRILMEFEGRVRLTLEKDYRLRHGGILRLPSDLVVHRRYDRPEIINHFGEQYDPARHNFGVISFKDNIVIIIKLDTSSAMQAHQYSNSFIDTQTFAWQSQNQQRQDNSAGRLILDHKTNGTVIHLFIQPRSHEKTYYCGIVEVLEVDGNAPMNVKFRLNHPLSSTGCNDLLG
jgi:superfamily II DNA or RNA helicase/HKD family nuclease